MSKFFKSMILLLLTAGFFASAGWAQDPVATWTDFSQDVRQQIDLSDGKTATIVIKLTFTEAAASLGTDATFASVTKGEVTATNLKGQGDGLHLHAYSNDHGIGANIGNGGSGTWADNRSAVGTNPHVVIVTLAWENDACILKYYVDGELAGRGDQKSFSQGNVSAMYFNTATDATLWSFSNAELYNYAFTEAQVAEYGVPTLTSAADTDSSGKISWAEFEAVRGDSMRIRVSGALEVEIADTDSPTLTALTINKVNESDDSLTFTGAKSLWSGDFALTTEIPVTATNWVNNPSLTLAGSGDVTIKKGDYGIGLVNGGYTGKLTLDGGQQVTNMSNSAFSIPFTVGDGGASLDSDSQDGWNVSSVISGSGTLTFNAANPLYLTAESTNFTGDAVVASGTVVLGNTNTTSGGRVSHFGNADTTITIKNGAAFKTHFGGGGHTNQTAYAPSFILEPGATLGNIDGHTDYTGDIVVNQGGDANSTSVFDCYWDKTNIISGALSGEGKLELKSQSSAHTLKIAPASGKTNTFAGTYFVNDSRVTLWAAAMDAMATATVQIANNGNFALGGDVKVAGLLGTQGTVKSDVQGTARTLTLCGTSDLTALTITDDVTIAIAEDATGTITLPAGMEEGLTIPANCTLVLKLSAPQVVEGYTNKATINGTFGGFLDSNGVSITDGVNGGVYVPQNNVKWENGAWDAEITTGAILQINFGETADQTCEVALGDITSIGALQVSGAVAGKIAITANNAVTIPVVAMNNTGAVEIASTQTINVTDEISGVGALTVTSGNISMTNAAVVATDYSGTLTLKDGVTFTWGNKDGNVVADTDYVLGSSLVLESGSTFKPNLHTGQSLNKGKAGKMRLATTVTLAGGTIEHPDGSYFYTKILVEEDSIININWNKGIAIERLLGDAALTIEGWNTTYGCAFVSVWWTQDQLNNPTEWYTGTLKLKSESSTYNGGLPKMEFYPDTGDAFKKAHVQFLNGNVKYNMAGNNRCMGALSGAAADIVATGNPTLTIGGYAGADAVGAYEGTISGTNITLNDGATLTMTGTLGTLSDDVATYEKAIALNANSHLKLGLAKKTILNGVISGSGTLTVESGTLTLHGTNTYTGGTDIAAGAALTITNAAALGTGAITGAGELICDGVLPANMTGLTDAANWTGTVKVQDFTGGTDEGAAELNLDAYGNANSVVELANVAGWVADGTVVENLKLSGSFSQNYGLTSAAAKVTIKKLSGAGNFNGPSEDDWQYGFIVNDCSEFTGSVNLKSGSHGGEIGLIIGTEPADYAHTNCKKHITVTADGVATIAAGATWAPATGAGGQTRVYGTIGGAGTITGALTLYEGATLDRTAGVVTANTITALPTSLKVLLPDAAEMPVTLLNTTAFAGNEGDVEGVTLTVNGEETEEYILRKTDTALTLVPAPVWEEVTDVTATSDVNSWSALLSKMEANNQRFEEGVPPTLIIDFGSEGGEAGTFTFNNEEAITLTSITVIGTNGGSIVMADGAEIDYGSLMLNTTVAADAAFYTANTGVIAGTGKLGLASGELTLDEANTYTGGTEIVAGATLTITNADALGTGAITGAGELICDVAPTNKSGLNVEAWTGTVGLNFALGNDADFTLYGNASSTIHLMENGSANYLAQAKTIASAFILDGTITHNNGWSTDGGQIFSGTFSGRGTLETSGTQKDVIQITGDTTEFTGTITVAGNHCVSFGEQSDDDTMLGKIVIAKATTIPEGKIWTATNGVYVHGSGTISGSGTIALPESATFRYESSKASTFDGDITGVTVDETTSYGDFEMHITSETASLTLNGQVEVASATVSEDANSNDDGMTLEGKMTVHEAFTATGTNLYLKGNGSILMKEGAVYTQGAITVMMSIGVELEAGSVIAVTAQEEYLKTTAEVTFPESGAIVVKLDELPATFIECALSPMLRQDLEELFTFKDANGNDKVLAENEFVKTSVNTETRRFGVVKTPETATAPASVISDVAQKCYDMGYESVTTIENIKVAECFEGFGLDWSASGNGLWDAGIFTLICHFGVGDITVAQRTVDETTSNWIAVAVKVTDGGSGWGAEYALPAALRSGTQIHLSKDDGDYYEVDALTSEELETAGLENGEGVYWYWAEALPEIDSQATSTTVKYKVKAVNNGATPAQQ